jgi:hypothetical protein
MFVLFTGNIELTFGDFLDNCWALIYEKYFENGGINAVLSGNYIFIKEIPCFLQVRSAKKLVVFLHMGVSQETN